MSECVTLTKTDKNETVVYYDMSKRTEWQPLLRCLEDPLRRRLLVELLVEGRQTDDIEVPEGIELGGQDRETARIELEHVHLPLLDKRGYIEWDRDADLVTEGPAFDEIRPLLDLIESNRQTLPDGWR